MQSLETISLGVLLFYWGLMFVSKAFSFKGYEVVYYTSVFSLWATLYLITGFIEHVKCAGLLSMGVALISHLFCRVCFKAYARHIAKQEEQKRSQQKRHAW